MSLGVATILPGLAIAFFWKAKARRGDRNDITSRQIAVIRKVVKTSVHRLLGGLKSSLPNTFIVVILADII